MKPGGANSPSKSRPGVLVVGDCEHHDLREAVELLRETGTLTVVRDTRLAAQAVARLAQPPELIVLAESRPGMVCQRKVRQLQQMLPLAGAVALLGSWCEGGGRSTRPWLGVERLYWHEFRWWWERQLARRRAGRCPSWAQMEGARTLTRSAESSPERGKRKTGLFVISTPGRETYAALADLLASEGIATAWQRPAGERLTLGGATAGIWDGGQLDDCEIEDLAEFCGWLAGDGAPVVALLDFPRRDRCLRALELGVAAAVGKPWIDADLVDAIGEITLPRKEYPESTRAA